jgi:hypothetical protein
MFTSARILGRIAAVLCIIEMYGHAPSAAELRACLAKYVAFWEQRAAKAKKATKTRRKGARIVPFVEPLLWILAAGRPTGVLEALRFTRLRGWPKGVYVFGGDVLRVCIVVASELPRDRSTLLVRFMAGGPLLAGAIEDLAALPPDAVERTIAEPDLLRLQHVLGKKPSPTPEEQEFVVTMQNSWENARKMGEVATGARDVLAVFRVRGIVVPGAMRDRILAEKDPARLARWHDRAILAASVAEALAEPSRAA